MAMTVHDAQARLAGQPAPTAQVPVQAAPSRAVAPSFSFDQLERMAKTIAASKMFGFKTEAEVFTILLVAQAENSHPALAMLEYQPIQGRPSLKADAMLARFKRIGGSVVWHKNTDAEVSGTFIAPNGDKATVTWDEARVQKAGLKGNHQTYPQQMKRARCISEGIRAVHPVTGLYAPEEVADMHGVELSQSVVVEDVRTIEGEVISPAGMADAAKVTHIKAIREAVNQGALKDAHRAAQTAAEDANDLRASREFTAAGKARQTELDKQQAQAEADAERAAIQGENQ